MVIEEEGERTTRRVFYALWPPPSVGAELERLSLSIHSLCGGRAMRRDTLHMTLAFIGPVASQRLAELRKIAGSARAQSFELEVDALAGQRRNRIVWAECSRMPQALRELVEHLSRSLASRGFPVESRAFRPHVTLLRNARTLTHLCAPQPLIWSVCDFVLVESRLARQGASYDVISRWPLSPNF